MHGLRDRRRARREDGRARSARLRAGRRRLVPDDGAGDRHRRAGARGDHDRAARQRTASRASAACRSRSAAADSARATAQRNPTTGELDGDLLPIDLAANAESLGATVWRANTIAAFREALTAAAGHTGVGVIVVPVDRESRVAGYESWWDVPVAEVSTSAEVADARAAYETRAAARSATSCDPRRQRALFVGRARIRGHRTTARPPRRCSTRWRRPATPAPSSATGGFCRPTPAALAADVGAARPRAASRAFVPVALARTDAIDEGVARAVRTARLLAAVRRRRSSGSGDPLLVCPTTTPACPTARRAPDAFATRTD